MPFKRNTFATYASQFYVTFIAIIMLPMYVRYMGAESYGLIGFYSMMQAWFQLLDMGLTPTITRETARYKGGGLDAMGLRHLLRALEGIFIGIALLGALGMIAGSGFIATSWLMVEQLPLVEVQQAIMLMAVIVALRWVCGLYRGAITGFERLVWLSGFNTAIATARFVLVIPFFIIVGTRPGQYFTYQLVIALVEVTVLIFKTYYLLPRVKQNRRTPWRWRPLRDVLKFSLTIAFTSTVWVLVTQTDKLVLSKLLPLSEYAYFTLAVLVANGILVVSGPISGTLLPRMTVLNAENNEAGLIRLYRQATQLVGVIAMPAAMVMAFFAEQLMWAWTGDADIAHKAAPVLTLYAIGNGLLALAAFPYYLQFAKGDLKMHLTGNLLFVMIFIPLLIWATGKYGMIGAGYAWITANLFPFVIWLPLVHARFIKGLHSKWLLKDVLPIFLLPLGVAFLLSKYVKWPASQFAVGIDLVLIGLGLGVVAALSSTWVRARIYRKFETRFAG